MNLHFIIFLSAITGLDAIDDIPDFVFPDLQWDIGIAKIDILYPFEALFNFCWEAIFDIIKLLLNTYSQICYSLMNSFEKLSILSPVSVAIVVAIMIIVILLILTTIEIIIP